jgi:hypothetical protein
MPAKREGGFLERNDSHDPIGRGWEQGVKR